jgi:peroxisomal 3,2-trans-enoyl-CoA isomerase
MADQDVVSLTYKGHIAIITINRPSRLNALNQDLYYLLADRLREVEKRDDIFITVLTATGRFFSA